MTVLETLSNRVCHYRFSGQHLAGNGRRLTSRAGGRSPPKRGRIVRARLIMAIAAVLLATFLTPPWAAQAVPPANFQTSLVVGAGLDGPSGFEIAPDGRIFILERSGA